MAKYVQWITHKGVRMLFVNGKGLPEAEYIAAFEELKQEVLKERSSAPVLIDLSNTSMTQKTTAKAKEVSAAQKAAKVPDAPSAVVGLSKLAKTVAQILNPGTHYFDTVDQAKEWLAKEAGKSQ
jgi:dihydropteroate synthase